MGRIFSAFTLKIEGTAAYLTRVLINNRITKYRRQTWPSRQEKTGTVICLAISQGLEKWPGFYFDMKQNLPQPSQNAPIVRDQWFASFTK